MVADDISAGSQDEEMTRHHSSSPRGPRPPSQRHTTPIKTAQTPSPTDLADPLMIGQLLIESTQALLVVGQGLVEDLPPFPVQGRGPVLALTDARCR